MCFFQKSPLCGPKSSKEDPVGITGLSYSETNTAQLQALAATSHLQVVVHHELQVEGHVALVGLQHLVHHSSPGQEVGGPFYHERVVEVELDEGVLPGVVAVERSARDLGDILYLYKGWVKKTLLFEKIVIALEGEWFVLGGCPSHRLSYS